MRTDYTFTLIAKIDKYQAETIVLFELISARCERRSLPVTAAPSFIEWDQVLVDRAITGAAVDRLLHALVIIALKVESYRRRQAQATRDKSGTP